MSKSSWVVLRRKTACKAAKELNGKSGGRKGKNKFILFFSYFGGLDVVACGQLLRPNSTPSLPPSLLIPLSSLPSPTAPVKGCVLSAARNHGFSPLRPWGHVTLLPRNGRIKRTSVEGCISVKAWLLMLTKAWIEVVDMSVPNLTRKQSGW